MYDRNHALSIAKQGFSAAMRRAAYEGTIGQFTYSMDRDEWAMIVVLPATGKTWKFPVRKSWQP